MGASQCGCLGCYLAADLCIEGGRVSLLSFAEHGWAVPPGLWDTGLGGQGCLVHFLGKDIEAHTQWVVPLASAGKRAEASCSLELGSLHGPA